MTRSAAVRGGSLASSKPRNNCRPGLSRPSHMEALAVNRRGDEVMLLNHTDEKLVRMANQIATFFLSQPENTRIEGVATHINKFWEPRMRRRFFEMVDAGAGEFLPLVLAASAKIRRPDAPVAAAAGPGGDATGAPGGKGAMAGAPLSEPSVPETTRA